MVGACGWHSGRLGVALALITSVLLSLVLAAPVAAANNIVVLGYFGDCQFSGSRAGAFKTVKIEWRDSDGVLKSRHSVTSNAAGVFMSKCESGELIEKGDVLKTTIGTSVRSFNVPKLTARVNRENDSVKGKVDPVPDGLLVSVVAYHGGFSIDGTTRSLQTPLLVGQDFTTEFARWDHAPDIQGWDDVFVSWANARGDMFVRYVAAQGIIVWARQQYVDVAGNPGEEVELALSNPPPTLLASTTVRLASSGRGLAEFLDADSDPLRIRVGMVVESSLAVDADVLVPDISVVINKTADTVMANCGRGWLPTGVLVTARTRDLSKRVTRTGFADGSGAFLANFRVAPAYNIVAGDKIDVYCKQDSGDIVAQTFTVG